MKIVFLADALDIQYAGIYTYCKGLLTAINSINPLHDIYVIRASDKKEFNNLNEINIPIKKAIPAHQRLRQFTSIPAYINKLKPDVVFEMAHFGPFKLDKGIKRVTFIHDLSPILFPQWHPVSSVYAHRLFLKGILRKADLVLTNSQFTKSEIARLFPMVQAKTHVTLLGYDAPITGKSNNQLTLQKLNIEQPYFLYVGTLEPRKNLEVLLKAYESFRTGNPDKSVNLVLTGKMGWKNNALLKQIKASQFLNEIKIAGFVDEVSKITLFKNALAFVYPSLYEGFGLPVLEAMAYECPVICSNAASLPEVGGKAALYFDPNDMQSLKKLFNKVATESNYKATVTPLLRQQSKKFSWKNTASATLKFIENCK